MGYYIIRENEAVLVFKRSELNISPLFVGDKNKGKYISSEQVDKDEGKP